MNGTATIALAGNPNSGKTTLFNAITGARQRVGNYPGITVERKEGTINLDDVKINVVDLPGCYSLSAYSQEELVARKVLVDERPDIVVDIVDATRLERHLYLAVQFFELGIPVVLALNMMDEAGKQGVRIDSARLASLLNCPVVETVARSGQGKQELMRKALDHAKQRGGIWEPLKISYGPDLDVALDHMVEKIEAARFMTNRYPARWVALKYLETDAEVLASGRTLGGPAQELEAIVQRTREHIRKTLNTVPEALIADYRYGLINSILRQDVISHERTQEERIDVSAKLDSILTNRLLGPAMTFPGLPEEAASKFAADRQAIAASADDQEQRQALIVEIDNLEAQATLKHSVAGRIGSFFEPVSQWAGFDWRTNIALVGGFAAKEVIVSTFGTAYSLGEVDPEDSSSLSSRIAADPAWNKATALALIVFVLLYAPCFVTVVTMAKESSWRWALFSTCFNTALGFGLAVVAYQVGSILLV